MKGLDVLGADYGDIISTLFQAAGGGVDYARASEAENKVSVSAAAALADTIAADQAATSAIAQAASLALVVKADPSKKHDLAIAKAAADKAIIVQDKAGAVLLESKRADRIKAAQNIVDAAVKKVSAATGTAKLIAQAYLDAANMTLSKAKGESQDKKDKGDKGDKEGLLSRSIVGGFKVWHGLATAVVAIIGVVVVKKFKHK